MMTTTTRAISGERTSCERQAVHLTELGEREAGGCKLHQPPWIENTLHDLKTIIQVHD